MEIGGGQRGTRERLPRGRRKLECDGYVHSLDGGTSSVGVYMCQKLPNCSFYVQFVLFHSYYSKPVQQENRLD